MGKFTGMLFTSDFDHTISDHEDRVPQANLEAISYFIEEGGYFCLNTGRSIAAARRKALQIPCNAPCLLYNGAACYDYRKEKLIFAHTLSDRAAELLPHLQEPGVSIEIQGLHAHYSAAPVPSREPMLRKAGLEMVITDDPPKPWMKIILCGTEGSVLESYSQADSMELQRFRELKKRVDTLCGEDYYVTCSMPRIIEIGNPHYTKATGARELARLLGCHTLICAGDAPNDTPMLLEGDWNFCPTDCSPEILTLPNIIPTVPSAQGIIAVAVAYLEDRIRKVGLDMT